MVMGCSAICSATVVHGTTVHLYFMIVRQYEETPVALDASRIVEAGLLPAPLQGDSATSTPARPAPRVYAGLLASRRHANGMQQFDFAWTITHKIRP